MIRTALVLLLALFPAVAQEGKLSIVQGATDAGSTQVSIVVPRGESFELALKPGDGGMVLRPDGTQRVTSGASRWAVLKARFSGLQPGLDYELFVIGAGPKVRDKRVLRAFDPSREEGIVAVASCLDDTYVKEQKGMWEGLLSLHPDLLLLIGDNCYADVRDGRLVGVTAAGLWERYAETRNALALYKAERLVPILATWDDHDYGANNSDRTFPLKERATEVFRAFWAQEPVRGLLTHGPGVASTFKAFGQRFLLMDGRSFRSPNKQPLEDETHWGELQETWLYSHLRDAATPAFVVNGDQIFGGYQRFESYEGSHPRSFDAMLAQLREAASPVAFVSGDRHLAELMEIKEDVLGYETFELTTSGIHARMFPGSWDEAPNPRQVAGVAGVLNYAILKTGGSACAVAVYGPNRKLLFERALTIGRRK